ncbi:MAG: hypothetical protein Q7U02_09950 [Desulfosalsimonadaceae bacterium]|nr:hypothetical protein [Desulfosalsimonadaceae bacterium]
MNQKIKDKVTLIKESLRVEGLVISERAGGIRVKLDSGDDVDIYALSSSPDHVRARIKTRESDDRRRQALIESAQKSLSQSLGGLARIEPFRISRETGGMSIYNAVVEMEKPQDADEPVEISEDAVKVISDGGDDPIAALPEDPDMFQFDFDIDDNNRLKTISSLAEKAMSQLESVDAKMLRQSLDMMSLKRSSAVRLALTRIFRSALDIKELESAIQSEALKIVTPEDRKELQTVKSLSVNGFLDAVVDLLWQEVFNNQY